MRRLTTAMTATALTLVGLAGCSSGPSAAPAARAYLAAWSSGSDARAAALTDSGVAARQVLSATRQRLHVGAIDARLGAVSTSGAKATAKFTATMTLLGLGSWTYDGRLLLRRTNGHWHVHWDPSDVHPSLTTDTQLSTTRTLPPRASILDGAGHPLFASRPIVNVGVEPSRLKGHLHDTVAVLVRTLHVDGAGLTAAIRAARPDEFVPVITLRRAAYAAVKPTIYSLPGTVFTTGHRMLPPSTGFGQALLGTVGQATADVLKAAGHGYLAGDELGLSGLQLAFQKQLSGTASGSVVVNDATGAVRATLKTFTGTPGTPLRSTIDRRMQLAAEQVLANVSKPAALVAVRASTGAVLAVANTPDATSFDRALDGRYPPGSTFKVVTTYALLGRGVTPSTPVPCTPTIAVNGKVFRNFESESLGSPPFARDFALSCNTAFIRASGRLGRRDLADSAHAFGVGARWQLPLDTFSGSVPVTSDPVTAAADAIGQGQVQVSPLTMALVAAAVDVGHVVAPRLLANPAQESAQPAGALEASRLRSLRTLMRLVVTSGTAAPAHLPSGTFGKTGTAEFGTGPHPQTHAWFIGYRGDIAFAVLVEGGGVGGAVAAPIASAFLRQTHA